MTTKKKTTKTENTTKRRYTIAVPITGTVQITVEAESEEEALENLWRADMDGVEPSEWEMHRCIVQGNVFHGMQNEAEVIDVEDIGGAS